MDWLDSAQIGAQASKPVISLGPREFRGLLGIDGGDSPPTLIVVAQSFAAWQIGGRTLTLAALRGEGWKERLGAHLSNSFGGVPVAGNRSGMRTVITLDTPVPRGPCGVGRTA
jgi:hypothetical protein